MKASIVFQIKSAYINFLNHCYVDTEVEMKEIYNSMHIWTLFEDFMVDMAKVSSLFSFIISITTHSILSFLTFPLLVVLSLPYCRLSGTIV